jgi:hypothetical protein
MFSLPGRWGRRRGDDCRVKRSEGFLTCLILEVLRCGMV